MKIYLTDADVDAIEDAHRQGTSLRCLARQAKVSRDAITRRLRARWVETRPSGTPRRVIPTQIRNEARERIAGGESVSSVAKHFGIPRTTFRENVYPALG